MFSGWNGIMQETPNQQRRPIDGRAAALMVLLCAIWGTQQVVIKLFADDMSPLLQVGIRSALASIVILTLILRRRETRWFGGVLGPGMLSGLLFGMEFLAAGEGLRFTSAAHMSIFLYTAPVFASLGLQLRDREERLSGVQWAGIALAFLGVAFAFTGGGSWNRDGDAWIGDLLGIAAGASWGMTTVVVRTTALRHAPATVTLWYQLAGGALLGLSAAVLLGDTDAHWSMPLVASLAYQSIIVSAVSFLVWFSLMRVYLASRLGILSFMTPLFGMAFGVAILGEKLTPQFLLGAVMILAGILVVSGRDLLFRRRISLI